MFGFIPDIVKAVVSVPVKIIVAIPKVTEEAMELPNKCVDAILDAIEENTED